jgi:hypothetical protein
MTTASLVFSHNNGSTSQGIIGGIEQAPVEGATPARALRGNLAKYYYANITPVGVWLTRQGQIRIPREEQLRAPESELKLMDTRGSADSQRRAIRSQTQPNSPAADPSTGNSFKRTHTHLGTLKNRVAVAALCGLSLAFGPRWLIPGTPLTDEGFYALTRARNIGEGIGRDRLTQTQRKTSIRALPKRRGQAMSASPWRDWL